MATISDTNGTPDLLDDGKDFHLVDVIARAVAARLHPKSADYILAVVAAERLEQDMRAAIKSGVLQAFRPGPVPAPPLWKPDPNERSVWVKDDAADAWLRQRKLSLSPRMEDKAERQRRRFDRYYALGGKCFPKTDGGWVHRGVRGALARLVREEKAANRKYNDDHDVRKDLDAEADRRAVRY